MCAFSLYLLFFLLSQLSTYVYRVFQNATDKLRPFFIYRLCDTIFAYLLDHDSHMFFFTTERKLRSSIDLFRLAIVRETETAVTWILCHKTHFFHLINCVSSKFFLLMSCHEFNGYGLCFIYFFSAYNLYKNNYFYRWTPKFTARGRWKVYHHVLHTLYIIPRLMAIPNLIHQLYQTSWT